jgi:cellulose synthase/poly-beta-1,6-N-acetylglucosamine synthase-like glycosyltransferase
MSRLLRFANFLSIKRNFYRTSIISFGTFTSVLGAWPIANYGLGLVILFVPMCYVGGYFWGVMMWHLMFRDRFAALTLLSTDQVSKPSEVRAENPKN